LRVFDLRAQARFTYPVTIRGSASTSVSLR